MATGRLRWAWWLLAWASLALGVVGIVVPGSKRLHAWLRAHRRFGPMIRDWQARGAVSRRAKWLATAMMALAATVMFATAPRWWMAATGTAIMAVVALWLWRRPEPPGHP